MKSGRSFAHELLLAAARRDVPARPIARASEEELNEALLVAARHGVAGWVARELKPVPHLPPAMKVRLQAVAAKVAGNHHRRVNDAHAALRVLSAAKIPAVALKGPVLVERYYRDPSLRSYTDVDLLVEPRRLRDAIGSLEEAGFGLLDAHWRPIISDLRGQVHFRSGRDPSIDLHWHLVGDARKRATFGMSIDEMWDAAEPSTLAGEPCLELAPGDELAYVCLH
ncbi:MAG: nucleotidyltransferase family protein, partial [Actinobacteria bacterium]